MFKRLLRIVLGSFWAACGAVIVFLWVWNTNLQRTSPATFHFLGLLIVAGFFYVEGLELAYTDLSDKDEQQVDPEIRSMLVEMREREHAFYDARELMVVLMIVVATVISDFPKVLVPGIQEITWHGARVLFTLACTSFPLLWIAQNPGKGLARRNSESFMKRSRFTWWLIQPFARLVEASGISLPSDRLLTLLGRWKPFRRTRNLAPSHRAFYLAALKRYGRALDSLVEHLVLHPDGSCTLTREAVLYIENEPRYDIRCHYDFDAPITSAKVTMIRAFVAPAIGERDDDLRAQLDSIANGQTPEAPFEEADATGFRWQDTYEQDNKLVRFRIQSPYKLPDGARTRTGESASAVVIHTRHEVHAGPGSFQMAFAREDEPAKYAREVSGPCRKYVIRIALEGDPGLYFAQAYGEVLFLKENLSGETARQKLRNESNTLVAEFYYPLPQAFYNIRWQVWAKAAAQAAAVGR